MFFSPQTVSRRNLVSTDWKYSKIQITGRYWNKASFQTNQARPFLRPAMRLFALEGMNKNGLISSALRARARAGLSVYAFRSERRPPKGCMGQVDSRDRYITVDDGSGVLHDWTLSLILGLQSCLLRFGMTGPEPGTHSSPTFETKVRLEP